MRIANIDNRAALVIGEEGSERALDLATASHGRFGPELPAVYDAWNDVTAWAAEQDFSALADDSFPIDRA
ncbi:MAG: fumarylacetoacetate hydrolase, partial [Rhodococcus sp. (in: high G+C Gram-positive bacteria)]